MEKTSEKKKSKVKLVFSIIVDVILGLAILIGIFVSIFALTSRANNGIPTFFNKSVLTVQSESMTGTFDKGDIIIINKFSDNTEERAKQLQELTPNESIVTFYYDLDSDGTDEIVTHLYKGTYQVGTQTLYEFKGTYNPDNVELASQYIASTHLIGRYTETRLSGFGTVLDFLRSSLGFGLVIMLPIFIFFLYSLIKLILVFAERNHEKTVKNAVASLSEEERERIKRELLEELKANGEDINKENKE